MPPCFDSSRRGAADAFDLPKVKADGLIPRFPKFDTFTRQIRLSDRTIIYRTRPTILDIDFQTMGSDMKCPNDNIVVGILEKQPPLDTAISCLVAVHVLKRSERKGTWLKYGSGILVSPSVVFTCENVVELDTDETILAIEVFAAGLNDPSEASIVNVGEQNNIDLNVTDFNESWMNCEGIDFAVLRLKTPIARPKFIEMPTNNYYPNIRIGYSQPTCVLGFPGPGPDDLSSVYPDLLVQEIRGKYPENASEIFSDLTSNSLFGFDIPIAAFGSVFRYLPDIGQYYVHHTASTYDGLSGGPVINPNYPEVLSGFSIGGISGSSLSVFLRADNPIVMKSYRDHVSLH